MDNFKWYDWLIIGIVSDFGAALVMAILSGSVPFGSGVILLPVLVFVWLMYEDLRKKQHDKETE